MVAMRTPTAGVAVVETAPGGANATTAGQPASPGKTPSVYSLRGLDRLHAAVARRNQEAEAELRKRFQALNGPGPE